MKIFLAICLSLILIKPGLAHEQIEILSTQDFMSHERLFLAPLDSWIFKNGDVPNAEKPDLIVGDWEKFNPAQLAPIWKTQTAE